MVLGQVRGDRVGNVVGPRLKLRQQRDHLPVETDELTAERQVLGRDVVQRGE